VPRLFGVDAARGVALLGMFAAHTIGIGTEQFFDGRSAILFATVAGVSLGLITGGAEPPSPGARGIPRVVVLVRACVLVLLGLLLTALVRPPIAVILDFYGFAFVLLLGVLFSSRALLVFLAAAVALLGPPIVTAVTTDTTLDDVPAPLEVFANWLFFGPYPVVVWLAFLLIGLVLARSDLHRRRTALVAFLGGAAAALVGYGSALVIPGTDISAHSGTTAEVLGSGGVAVAIVGALSLLDSATGIGERVARVLRMMLAPIAAAGAMALTLYTAHAIVLAIVQQTAEVPQRWQVPAWLFVVLAGAALVIAPLWQRFVGPGPLERALRELTRLVVRAPRRPRVAP
jgi:uncharacterized membrane protein YeiB